MIVSPEVEDIAAFFDTFPLFVDAVGGTVRADVEVGRLDGFGWLEGVWGAG